MNTQVDSRVVEMRFDNKQFEKETKVTLSTLQKLKAALNFTGSTKGLEEINRAVKNTKFDVLLDSVTALEKRFSTMGIVGMQIIQNLTNAISGKFLNAIRLISSTIDESGKKRAFNIENAHFQLQALLGVEEEVQKIMDDANASVTDTAYGFDEAAKAAAAFAATGITAGEEMQRALKGIAGVAAMTNSQYSDISMIFTTVAGQGRLMGDQLLQLASRGLNAASTLTDFFNGVNDGSKQASESVNSAIWALTKGLPVTETQIRDFVSKGKISFAIFSEAMGVAFGDSAKRANETFNGAISNMKAALGRIGAEFYSPLIAQNSEVVLLINSVKNRINDLKKALTFNKEIGNVNALSKQWTDFVLSTAASLRAWVDQVDLETPIKIFYHLVESVKNSANGLLQILTPIGKAIRQVFGESFKMENLEKLAGKLEDFTKKMKVSEKTSENLRKAFHGVFSVVKMLGDIFVKLLKAISPAGVTFMGMAEALAAVAGKIGEVLSKFSSFVSESKTVNKVFEILGKSVQYLLKGLETLGKAVVYLFQTFRDLPVVQRVTEQLKDFFRYLDSKVASNLDDIVKKLVNFKETLKVVVPEKINETLNILYEGFRTLIKLLNNVDFSTPKKAFSGLRDILQDLLRTLSGNQGVTTFITNLKAYLEELKEAFTIDRLLENIERFRSVVGGFVTWLHDIVSPIVEELNLGTFIAGGTGVGIVYALVKLSDSFSSIAKVIDKFKEIPKFFTTMQQTLLSYQMDLKANALLKIAGAIAILAASLTFLSFADPDRLAGATLALSSVMGIFLAIVVQITKTMRKSSGLFDVMDTFARGLSKSLNNLAKAVKWRAIGSALKSFAISVGILVAALYVLGKLAKEDVAALYTALDVLKTLVIILGVAAGVFALIGQILPIGTKNLESVGKSILAMSLSIGVLVLALNKLMEMEIPNDAETKLGVLIGLLVIIGVLGVAVAAAGEKSEGGSSGALEILALTAMLYVTVQSLDKLFKMKFPNDWFRRLIVLGAIFGGLAIVAMALGEASKTAGGGSIKATGTILALTVMLIATVKSLEKLMTMPLPEDWIARLGILAAIFLALGFVITMIGDAAGNAGGSIKAAGTILAMCVMLATIVGALMVLQMIPGDQLLKGAISLGVVLLALGKALSGAGKSIKPDAAKSVLAMAVMVGTIVAAISILSLIPIEQLAKAGAALGAMLLLLSKDFNAAAKMSKKDTWKSILAMAVITIAIATELSVLADYPWPGLLSAAGSMGIVLLSLAGSFKIIGDSNVDLAQVGKFLLASVSLIGIIAGIAILAQYPWQSLLAAGTAMSETLLAFSIAFFIISKSNPDPTAMAAFLVASASLLLVAASIAILADYDWMGLLAAGTAISMVLESMTKTMAVCSIVGQVAGPAIAGLGVLDLFIADLAAVFAALGWIFKSEDAKMLLNGGIDVLITIANGIGDFIDVLIMGTIEKMSARLPAIGENLSNFMDKLDGFIVGAQKIDSTVVNGVKGIASMLTTLTASSFIDGIASFFGIGSTSLEDFGAQLAAFGPYVADFGKSIRGIRAEQVEAASNLSQIISVVMQKLPRKNELMDKIFGEKKTLEDFGQELEDFGPHIKAFTESTEGIDGETVQGAANAISILADVNKKLPAEGGWLQSVFGEKDLKGFGEDLMILGPSLKSFALITADITDQSVAGAANALTILAEMADTIPNTGGLWADIWGDNTLDSFGIQLESLGTSLKNFSDSVADLELVAVSGACNQLTTLVGIFKQADGLDSSGMVNFVEALDSIADAGIDSFVDAFRNSYDRVTNAVDIMLGYISNQMETDRKEILEIGGSIGKDLVNAIKNGFSFNQATMVITVSTMMNQLMEATRKSLSPNKFANIASEAMNALNKGILTKESSISRTCSDVSSKILRAFSNVLSSSRMDQIGRQAMSSLSSGITSESYRGENAATRVARQVLRSFSDNFSYSDMYWIGANAALGLAYGITSRIYDIANAAIRASVTAINAAQKTLRVHSPSDIFWWMGEMLDTGLAGGILHYLYLISKASEKAGNEAIDSTKGSLSSISEVATSMLSNDFNPTFTPSIDFSRMERDCDQLTEMMNSAISTTYRSAANLGTILGPGDRRQMEYDGLVHSLNGSIGKLNRPNGPVYQNTFEIQGENPEEIAQEVSQILQRQVEREQAVWA